MKTLTVNTKKFTKDELISLIALVSDERKMMITRAANFEDFIKNPEDPKWKSHRYSNLPQEIVGVVVMLKQLAPQEYEESVQNFIKKFREEENADLTEISSILVKLEMRQ